jgi:serine/threonine protein phosphatase 1
MIQGLLDKLRTKKNPPREFWIPENQRVYAVGDIHGRADLVERMHEIIISDAAEHSDNKNFIIYLGDYLDRGPYVRETIDLLLTAQSPGFECVYLMGNHEQIFLNFLGEPSILSMWLGVGGGSTLMSYGLKPPGSGFSAEKAHKVRDELREKIPAEHIGFIKNLRQSFLAGDYLFVHAGIRPAVPIEDQTPEDLYWIRDEFLNSDADHGQMVIHGHTISEDIQHFSNRIGIDTGAYASGVLSCAVLEEDRVKFLST